MGYALSRAWPSSRIPSSSGRSQAFPLLLDVVDARIRRPASRHADGAAERAGRNEAGNTMKAFILDRYGSADRVRAADVPEPELREDDVLVDVRAAGLNMLDSKIRSGEFKRILPYRLPLILGHDVAGVVVRVGSRVRRFKAGDEGRLTGESVRSRNSLGSKKRTSRSSPWHSRWKKRRPSPWSA